MWFMPVHGLYAPHRQQDNETNTKTQLTRWRSTYIDTVHALTQYKQYKQSHSFIIWHTKEHNEQIDKMPHNEKI